MMLRHILTVLGCLIGVTSAAKGSVGTGRHVGWARTPPLAVGALSGFRFDPEPYLLEFHGVQCDFCDAMIPLMDRLFKVYRLRVKRHLVFEGTPNFRLMTIYDLQTRCKGLPFYYNRRTEKVICGATTWTNFKNWALCRDCKTFLPPALTPEQEEDAKPKKIQQDSLLEKIKAKTRGRKETTPKLDDYDT